MADAINERRRAGEALATRLIGLPEAAALALAEVERHPARVVKRDGRSLMRRMDLRFGRLNLDVDAGIVTNVRVE